MRRALVALIGAATVVAAASHAWGFTRETTDEGIPVYWTTSCVTTTVYLNGFSSMTPDEVAKSIGAAAHAWSPSEVTCPGADGGVASHPYFEIVPGMAAVDATAPAIADDARNVVVFRPVGWDDDTHPLEALALTSLTKKKDGRILDADMEINATDYTWANLDPGSPQAATGNGQTPPMDLQNATTHEFGHFIGLNHTCQGAADPVQLIDNNGQPVPDCNSAPPDVQATVMFPNINHGEVSKRVLSPDDIDAVCTVYPAAQDPHSCSLDLPDDGCGCAVGRRDPARSADGLVGLALGVGLAIRRGRGRRAGRARTSRRG